MAEQWNELNLRLGLFQTRGLGPISYSISAGLLWWPLYWKTGSSADGGENGPEQLSMFE